MPSHISCRKYSLLINKHIVIANAFKKFFVWSINIQTNCVNKVSQSFDNSLIQLQPYYMPNIDKKVRIKELF